MIKQYIVRLLLVLMILFSGCKPNPTNLLGESKRDSVEHATKEQLVTNKWKVYGYINKNISNKFIICSTDSTIISFTNNGDILDLNNVPIGKWNLHSFLHENNSNITVQIDIDTHNKYLYLRNGIYFIGFYDNFKILRLRMIFNKQNQRLYAITLHADV